MSARAAFAAWRSRTSPREQALVGLGALLVVAALAWTLVHDPLARDLASTERTLRDADTQLAQAHARADEIAGVAKAASQPVAADVRAIVERTLAQHDLRSAVTALQVKEARVELTFEAIDFAALTALVDALAREARLFPVEALLAARTTAGSVRAELALARDRMP